MSLYHGQNIHDILFVFTKNIVSWKVRILNSLYTINELRKFRIYQISIWGKLPDISHDETSGIIRCLDNKLSKMKNSDTYISDNTKKTYPYPYLDLESFCWFSFCKSKTVIHVKYVHKIYKQNIFFLNYNDSLIINKCFEQG